MSAVHHPFIDVKWRVLTVIPWYRQLLALIFGLGVMIISVWAIEQGEGGVMVASVVGMSFLTLLLIFGVEVDSVQIGKRVYIDFSDTTADAEDSDTEDEDTARPIDDPETPFKFED